MQIDWKRQNVRLHLRFSKIPQTGGNIIFLDIVSSKLNARLRSNHGVCRSSTFEEVCNEILLEFGKGHKSESAPCFDPGATYP